MANWDDILKQIQQSPRKDALDYIRKDYLSKLALYTKRNIITYYSGWLQKPGLSETQINDDDKNGFMNVIHGMDRTKGLDLLLHTPGGDTAATESIIDYLRAMFGTNIRAVIPQLAMSGGTMIACSCKEIVMGKQSSIGPIDPQFGGISCHGVVEEFDRALREITPKTAPIWQQLVAKYHPNFIGDCLNAIQWGKEIAVKNLKSGMFDGEQDAELKANGIARELSDHNSTKAHNRHISIDECQRLGLKIIQLESDHDYQDLVLSVHHSYMHTLGMSSAFKIIESDHGKAYIRQGVLQNKAN